MKEKVLKFKKVRLIIVGFFVFVLLAGSVGRLYFIQIVEHEKYADYSKGQYYQKIKVNQKRGKLLDRNETPLAITIPVKSVFAHPQQIEDKKLVARELSGVLGVSYLSLLKELNKDKNFVWIKRKVSDEIYNIIKEKDLVGVSFLDEDKRFYPHRTLASRVIGFSGIDNQGLAGLEYRYDKELMGEESVFIAQKDALGRIYGFSNREEMNSRFEMVTTIDTRMQYSVEKAVRSAFEHYGAKQAVAIVMATKTGEILALAEQPDFNPNDFHAYGPERYKAISVAESFEPGSTFKVFLAAAALDSGVATPDEEFDCENGTIKIGEHTVREANNHSYGVLTFSEIVSKSSNIGSIKIARRLGPDKFYKYIRKFGFGQKTGVDLPGESTGILDDYRNWSYMSLPSISFGQEVTATAVQIVTALSVIGNGGVSVQPHLLKEIRKNGKVIERFKSPPPRRIISRSAAKQTIEMMRLTITNGTGGNAALPGYALAGKTGTAQKFDKAAQQYSKDKHLASFVALFPSDDPIVSIFVMVDEPEGAGWGGQVAAPIVKEIAYATAHTLGIPSNDDVRYAIDWNELEEKYGKRGEEPVEIKSAKLSSMEKLLARGFSALKGSL